MTSRTNKDRLLIGISGLPLAGKTEAVKTLKEMGIPEFKMSTAVKKEMKEKNIEINNRNLRNFATEIRDEKGRGIVANLCLPFTNDLLEDHNKIVIDGLRSPEELEIFRNNYGENFINIALWASQETRYERVKNRKRSDDDIENFEDFQWRDNKELGWGLGDTMVLADYFIKNEKKSKKELKNKIKEIVRSQ